ncbi:hypothetical protein [Sphingomonas gilva]|uniref:hypothetical protein n=1 Tax=Sphingomonas gilva TaxID=2305907 RepID=UPI0011C4A79B|nr:hypothetical protein [Sphingomonas gilva]
MKIYGFASDSLTNIWAGIGSGQWAVGSSKNESFSKGRLTKAQKMPIGAFGILYCTETTAYTTPFVVYSKPDPQQTVTNIWSEPWVLPFSIKPLGNPTRSMSVEQAKLLLPSMHETGRSDPRKHLITVQGNFAFQASEISDADWSALIENLAI